MIYTIFFSIGLITVYSTVLFIIVLSMWIKIVIFLKIQEGYKID